MTFEEAFTILYGHEGGYTNNRDDPGNWTGGKVGVGQLKGTKYGIAANTYPHLDIKNLTLDRAQEIYRADYWNPIKADFLPAGVRFDVFDAAVNSGVKRASVWLQEAVKAVPDGVIGPKTLAMANQMDGNLLSKRFNGVRLQFMSDLSTWTTFGKGWARRIASNLRR